MKNLGISVSLLNPVQNIEQPHLWGVQVIMDPNLFELEDGEELSEKQHKELDRQVIDFMFEFPGIEGPIEPNTRMMMFRKSLEKILDVLSLVNIEKK